MAHAEKNGESRVKCIEAQLLLAKFLQSSPTQPDHTKHGVDLHHNYGLHQRWSVDLSTIA